MLVIFKLIPSFCSIIRRAIQVCWAESRLARTILGIWRCHKSDGQQHAHLVQWIRVDRSINHQSVLWMEHVSVVWVRLDPSETWNISRFFRNLDMTLDISLRWLTIGRLTSAVLSHVTQTITKRDCLPAITHQETSKATESTAVGFQQLAVGSARIPTTPLSAPWTNRLIPIRFIRIIWLSSVRLEKFLNFRLLLSSLFYNWINRPTPKIRSQLTLRPEILFTFNRVIKFRAFFLKVSHVCLAAPEARNSPSIRANKAIVLRKFELNTNKTKNSKSILDFVMLESHAAANRMLAKKATSEEEISHEYLVYSHRETFFRRSKKFFAVRSQPKKFDDLPMNSIWIFFASKSSWIHFRVLKNRLHCFSASIENAKAKLYLTSPQCEDKLEDLP